MTISLELEPDLEARVTAQANQRGLPLPLYLYDLIAQAAPPLGLTSQPEHSSQPELLGWPESFFEQTYGSLASDPIERLPQPEMEARELLA